MVSYSPNINLQKNDKDEHIKYSPSVNLRNDKDERNITIKVDILEQRPNKLAFSDIYRKLSLQRDFDLINEKANTANKWSKYIVMATAEKEKIIKTKRRDLKSKEIVESTSSRDEILLKEGIYLHLD
jgi:hypothetical protein